MRNWPVAPVVGIEPLAGGQTPVYRVDTADGDAWVLKDRGTLEHARLLRLAFDAGVMRHLDEAGVAVPVLQPDRDGRLWVAEGGRAWTLARYLPAGGGRKTDGEHRRWWANVGRALATLHLALATYPVDDGVLDVTWREDLPSRLTAETEVAMQKLGGSELDRFRAAARAVLEPALTSLQGLPEQLIHRDAHPGNIVSDGPRVVGFVDCDHFCLAPPVFDLAYFAVHMVKWSVGDPQATEVWLDRLPLLVAGYEDVAALAPRELAAFAAMLLAVVTMFAASARAKGDVLQTEVAAFLWFAGNLERITQAVTPGAPAVPRHPRPG